MSEPKKLCAIGNDLRVDMDTAAIAQVNATTRGEKGAADELRKTAISDFRAHQDTCPICSKA